MFLDKLDTKYTAYVAGMGGAKSTSLFIADMLFHLKHPGVPTAIYEPSFRLIKDIVYKGMREVAEMLDCKVKIRTGDKEIDVFRGGRYYGTTCCQTMDDPNNIMGSEYAHICVDEMDRLSAEKGIAAWNQIIGRARYLKKGLTEADLKVRVGTTPEGFKSVYQLFAQNPKSNYSMVQASTYENAHNLPETYIDELIETYPEALIDAYINGDFVNLTSGTVYRSYNRDTHDTKEEVREDETLHVGMDFNVGRMCAVIFVKRDKTWHAVDEIHDEYNTTTTAELLRQRYPKNRIIVYPDSSGKNRKTVGKGVSESDIAILRQDFNFECRYKSANPRVQDRVNAMNKAFEVRELRINVRRCPWLVQCLEQQAYDKNGQPDKDGPHDDMNDSCGYFVAYTMPIVKPIIDVNFKRAFV